MQINIPDRDVKLHTRILQRLQLLLIAALGITVATLYNAGAFSDREVTDSAQASDTKLPVVAITVAPEPPHLATEPIAPTQDAVAAFVDDSDSLAVAGHDEVQANQETTSRVDPESNGRSVATLAQAVPVVQLPIPEHESFQIESGELVSNPDINQVSPQAPELGPPALLAQRVADRSRNILGDYIRIRQQFKISGQQIADAAKRLAALNADENEVAANPTEDTMTLETARSSGVDSGPVQAVADAIIIRNAKINRGTVAFLVGREVKQLKPGGSLTLPPDQTSVVVRFHRGGEFGNATLTLMPGTYQFEATARGWYLETVED